MDNLSGKLDDGLGLKGSMPDKSLDGLEGPAKTFDLNAPVDDTLKVKDVSPPPPPVNPSDIILRDGSHFDEFGNLKPNVTYQAGEFEYIYKTDESGCLKEWNVDELHLTARDERLKHDPNTPGKIRN